MLGKLVFIVLFASFIFSTPKTSFSNVSLRIYPFSINLFLRFSGSIFKLFTLMYSKFGDLLLLLILLFSIYSNRISVFGIKFKNRDIIQSLYTYLLANFLEYSFLKKSEYSTSCFIFFII